MRDYFDVTELDSDQTARERIAGKLLLLDESFGEDLPLIFDFLAVPDPERPAPRMDPEVRQRQLLGLTKRLIRAQSAREPGVTVFEDLHWFDPASEVFLANHVEATQGTRGLTILNFRPEYRAPWMSKSFYHQIAAGAARPRGDPSSCYSDLLGSDPSLDGLLGRHPRAHRGQPVLHRGGRALAGRDGESRGRARRLQAGPAGRGDRGAGERAGRPLGPDRPARGAREGRARRRPR